MRVGTRARASWGQRVRGSVSSSTQPQRLTRWPRTVKS